MGSYILGRLAALDVAGVAVPDLPGHDRSGGGKDGESGNKESCEMHCEKVDSRTLALVRLKFIEHYQPLYTFNSGGYPHEAPVHCYKRAIMKEHALRFTFSSFASSVKSEKWFVLNIPLVSIRRSISQHFSHFFCGL